ncbi:MAG: DUF4381 domain-containing protein [Gammaproteobacteria bacterium]|nr:DUF4381 domain-containing protein [Gammaproteobacteria bacterium]NND38025.1 DUF4381 domain-containing protein [Pseudomonadales bacterium]RZV60024.1 MAG: DUF4381 family protein [Pseudomonadales bacterium]
MPNTSMPGVAVSSSADPLANLPPLATPAPVSWWPPAPGWWLLFFALLALLLASFRWARPRWRRYRRYRHCKKNLAKAFADARARYQRDANPVNYLFLANRALRGFALMAGSKKLLMQSADEEWLRALDALSDRPGLASAAGAQLLLQYQAQPDVNVASLHSVLQEWSAGLRINKLAFPADQQKFQLQPAASRATQ